jgi:hypothetical protein
VVAGAQQYIGMNGHPMHARTVVQAAQERITVLRIQEDGLLVVALLQDMMNLPRQRKSCESGHGLKKALPWLHAQQ